MTLFDEDVEKRKIEKNKKIKSMVVLGISLTIVLIIALIIAIYFLIRNPNKITVEVNGKEQKLIEEIITREVSAVDDSTIIYFPIRDLAKILGYKSLNGEYNSYENTDSCHVESKEEIVNFVVDSNVISKIDVSKLNDSKSSDINYEYIDIDNPVIKKDEKLYVDLDGVRKAFNFIMPDYDEKSKKISITTLRYLESQAKKVATNKGYKDIDSTFVNKRALLQNRIVVTDATGKKGLIGFSGADRGKEFLGAQYEDITYIPQNNVYRIKRNEKIGIKDENGITKITEQYDELTLIDDENDLYIAKRDNKYGVIDINENTIIYIEYDKIGVNVNAFAKNGVKNGKILLGKLIPVEQQGKIGFYSLVKNNDGTIGAKLITKISLDGVGCITKVTNKGLVSNLMLLEDYDIVVVAQNGYYGLMYSSGNPAIALALTDLYMETQNGETKYYMVYNNQTVDMIDYFTKHGIIKVNRK